MFKGLGMPFFIISMKKVVARIEFLDTCFYIPDVNIKNSRL